MRGKGRGTKGRDRRAPGPRPPALGPRPSALPRAAWPTAAAALVAVAAAAAAVSGRAGHDYVQFHAAATLLAEGRSPYGFEDQARAQRALRDADGPRAAVPDDPYEAIGVLPYFYPPWLALACVPLTALGYPAARAAWVYLGAQALVGSGYGLAALSGSGSGSGRVSRPAAVALALGLMPCYASVRLGQTPPLVIAGLVGAAWLLGRGRDRAAWAALAWAVVKPQLAVVAVPAVLLWSARRGRWGVVGGFAAALAALGLAAALVVPDWPLEMLRAPSRVPLPTALDPSVGVTWLSVVTTLGLSGRWRVLGYLAAALPAALAALWAGWDRTRDPDRPAIDAVAAGLIAAFFAAPYALGYDLAVLVVPLVVLLPRLPAGAGAAVVAVAAVGPYAHLAAVAAGVWQVTFFAWPAAAGALWVMAARAGPVSGGRR